MPVSAPLLVVVFEMLVDGGRQNSSKRSAYREDVAGRWMYVVDESRD